MHGSNGFKDYNETNLKDQRILGLAKRVTLEIDKVVDSEFPATRGARIRVKLKNGSVREAKVDYCKGLPQNPLTRQEFENKFRDLTANVTDKNQADEIIKVIGRMDQEKDVSGLIALMAR